MHKSVGESSARGRQLAIELCRKKMHAQPPTLGAGGCASAASARQEQHYKLIARLRGPRRIARLGSGPAAEVESMRAMRALLAHCSCAKLCAEVDLSADVGLMGAAASADHGLPAASSLLGVISHGAAQ